MTDRIQTFQDAIMPRSTIKNCAKQVLREDTIIQKDALSALTRSSTVFISYLTTHANEIALSKKRKTIMPNDVFEALKVIEFERFLPVLRDRHEAAETQGRAKRDEKKRVDGGPASGTEATEGGDRGDENEDEGEDEEEGERRVQKRVRIEGDQSTEMDGVVRAGQSQDQDPEDEDEGAEDDDDDDEGDEDDEDEVDALEGEDEDEAASDDVDGVAVPTLTTGMDHDDEFENRQRDTYDEALDDGEEDSD